MNPERPILSIALVIAIRPESREVLIKPRASDKHAGGGWEFPGGKVEPGETPEDAALREFDEEVGLPKRKLLLWKEHTHAYPERTVCLSLFLATLHPSEIVPPPACLVPFDRLLSLPMPEGNRIWLPQLVERLETLA